MSPTPASVAAKQSAWEIYRRLSNRYQVVVCLVIPSKYIGEKWRLWVTFYFNVLMKIIEEITFQINSFTFSCNLKTHLTNEKNDHTIWYDLQQAFPTESFRCPNGIVQTVDWPWIHTLELVFHKWKKSWIINNCPGLDVVGAMVGGCKLNLFKGQHKKLSRWEEKKQTVRDKKMEIIYQRSKRTTYFLKWRAVILIIFLLKFAIFLTN